MNIDEYMKEKYGASRRGAEGGITWFKSRHQVFIVEYVSSGKYTVYSFCETVNLKEKGK